MKTPILAGIFLVFLGVFPPYVSSFDKVVQIRTYTITDNSENPFNFGLETASGEASVSKHERSVTSVVQPTKFLTKTVYGFLNFVTTIGDTVLVFTPNTDSKESSSSTSSPPTRTTSYSTTEPPGTLIYATPVISLDDAGADRVLTPASHRFKSSEMPELATSMEVNLGSSVTQDTMSLERLFSSASSKARLISRDVDDDEASLKLFKRPGSNLGHRPDPIFFEGRKRPPRLPFGGSTITPITVEGTGVMPAKTLHSRKTLVTPSEVVVTAIQGFGPISVVGPFKNPPDNHIDDSGQSESLSAINVKPANLVVSDLKSHTPTGLVTTLGGTMVSGGLTTVHKTSVIGTFIEGRYAQVLHSTSQIFGTGPSPELQDSTARYKDIVDDENPVNFITQETTAALPLESLFSAPFPNRNKRLEETSARPFLSKRRGPNQFRFSRPNEYYDLYSDQEDYDRMNLRQSFRPRTTSVTATPVYDYYESEFHSPTARYRPTPTHKYKDTPVSTFRRSQNTPKLQINKSRWRLTSPRPQVIISRRPPIDKTKLPEEPQEESLDNAVFELDPTTQAESKNEEQTLRVVTNWFSGPSSDLWEEVATLRSLHTFRVGVTDNTRFVTYTKTFTRSSEAEPLPATQVVTAVDVYETPLFENILDDSKKDIFTLPPIRVTKGDIGLILSTVTETYSTTEQMLKVSVLPVLEDSKTSYHTLTQTYLITRVVIAMKTIPPADAFNHFPEHSLNEFNDKLLAEGSDSDASLFPSEIEYDENGDLVTDPHTTYKDDLALSKLAGGQFNPEAFEKQQHPELVAALKNKHKPRPSTELETGKQSIPERTTFPTPTLSPEQLQMAYLRLFNPLALGALPGLQIPQMTVTSSPVTVVTDVTSTSTTVLRVIFQARPMMTTISSTTVIHTTLTTYSTTTVTVAPQFPGLGGFPFAGVPFG